MSASSASADLFASARRSLAEASMAVTPGERYVAAHLAALRAAAAVLASRSTPSSRRSRVRSVWSLLPRAAAEFSEWAEFFALTARKRAGVDAGLDCVSVREADDLLRDAEAFLVRVAAHLGVPYQSSMYLLSVG
jgi:hypothetical protein